MRKLGLKIGYLISLFLLFFLGTSLAQVKGGRDAAPPKATPKRVTAKGISRPAPRPRLATIVLNVSPSDSTLLIDNLPFDRVDSLGTAKLTELKPGPHSVTVRRAGYREKQQSLELKAGDNEPVSIMLELLKGTLSVLPGVSEAEINLKSVDLNQNVGSYFGKITQIEFPPGDYDLAVSKKGYKTATRRFTLKAGESVYLEPQLEPLPKPRPQIAMSAPVRLDGKYLIVQLLGTSGADLPRAGVINVSATKGAGFADASGTFAGLPCEVDLVRLDNVSEASLIEVPSLTNQWAKAIVRVRAKDSKRPVRFAINWKVVEGGQLNLDGRLPESRSSDAGINDLSAAPRIGRVEVPSTRYQSYSELGETLRVSVPVNWRPIRVNNSVWFAPQGGYGQHEGRSVFTHGVNFGFSQTQTRDLDQATDEFLRNLVQGNPNLRQSRGHQRTTLSGRTGRSTVLSNTNEVTTEKETVTLVTTKRRNGDLFFMIAVAPDNEASTFQSAFGNILRSLQLVD